VSSQRVAIVTGGARRVGEAIVRGRAARGDAIVLHHGNSPAEADALAEALRAQGTSVHVVQADLAVPGAAAHIVDEAMRVYGRLDIVISSASVMGAHEFESVTDAEWQLAEAVNLRAPFFLMQAAARVMTTGGVIIQMSDHLAFETIFPHLIPHQVTKAAVTQLVKTLASALAPRLRVNAVAPGLVLPPEGFTERMRESFLADVPLAREGTTDDVVQAIEFLIEAPYVTGVVLEVDGGRHLRR